MKRIENSKSVDGKQRNISKGAASAFTLHALPLRVLIITMLFSAFILGGVFGPKEAVAAISTLDAWTPLFNSNSSPGNLTFPVSAGSGANRMLVVAVASSQTANGTRTVTITYGGQSPTSSVGDMALTTIRAHTQLYYWNEAALDAATNTTLAVAISGGTVRVNTVFAATFDGVDQTAPITNSQTDSNAAAVSPFAFGTALTVNAGDKAIEIISTLRAASTTPRTITAYATNWSSSATEQTWNTTDGVRNAMADRSIPGTNTTDTSSTTLSGTALGSMTGLSLHAALLTPTLSITNSPVTYNGAQQSATVTCSSGGAVSNIQYNASSTAPTNAATYAVTANCAVVAGYTALTNASAGNFVINPAATSASVSNTPQNYTGAAQSATVTCTGGGASSNISTGGAATQTNAGTYAVTATCAASTNYAAGTGIAAGNFVINNIAPTASVTNSPVTYNALPQSATVTCLGGGTVSNILYGGSATVPTNANTYAVTANCAASTNYNAATGLSAGNFIINKATNTPAVSNSPQAYTGSALTILVTCSSGSAATSITPATLTNVGSTAVTASCPGNVNYIATVAAAAGNFVINNATPTLSITNSPVTYNGSPQAATVTCSSGGAVSNILYGGSATVPTNINTYAVTGDCAAVTNYNSLTGASAGSFIISAFTSRVQFTTGFVNSGTSIAMTALSSTPINGNTLIAAISTRSNAANKVSSITQTGASWSRVASTTGTGGSTSEIWYAPNVQNAGTGITITLTTGNVYAAAVVAEYSGVLSADVNAFANNNNTNASTGTTGTTNAAVELWFGGIGLVSSGYTLGTPTNAFTSFANVASTFGTPGTNAKVYALEKIVSATGTANSGGTVSTASQWSGAIATFLHKSDQTITAGTPAPGSAVYGATFNVAATSTSALPVVITATGGCIVSGATITMTSGTTPCVVHYNQPGNNLYNAAPELTNTTTAIKATVTPTVNLNNKIYDGTMAAPTIYSRSLSGIIGTDNVALGTIDTVAAFSSKNVGTYTLLVSGLSLTGSTATNYVLSATSVSASSTITVLPITVTADAKSKLCGAADPTLTYTSSALLGSDVFTGVLSRNIGEIPGTYTINQNTLSAGGNYGITYVSALLTITTSSAGLSGTIDITLSSMTSAGPTLTWTPLTGATSYTIYRTFNGVEATAGTAAASPFADTGANTNTIYTWTVAGVNSCGGAITSAGTTTRTSVLPQVSGLGGWNLVSLPYNTGANYDTTKLGYAYTWVSTYPATCTTDPGVCGNWVNDNSLDPGYGYFVRTSGSAPQSTVINCVSGCTAVTGAVPVTLQPGYTLISNPTTNNMTGIGTSWLLDGTALSQAILNNTINGAIWWWDGTGYDSYSISDPLFVVEPWKSYWILNQSIANHTLRIQ